MLWWLLRRRGLLLLLCLPYNRVQDVSERIRIPLLLLLLVCRLAGLITLWTLIAVLVRIVPIILPTECVKNVSHG